MNKKLSFILGFAATLLFGLVVFSNVGASQEDVCPHGGEWSEHQDPPFASVSGALEYCWKGGNLDNNGRGCDGFLYQSSDPNDYPPEGDHVCGLSHWSYRSGTPTPTVYELSNTPTQTVTPTVTPSPEPTVSQEKFEEVRQSEGAVFGPQK